MKVLEAREGMFGPVWVADHEGQRQLMIGRQVQGASVVGKDGEPGPIAVSNYLSGWLLAGAQNPNSSGLMIGLGSGAGVVGLLHNFPDMDLTCIEIDPEVISLATTYFPLIVKYQDEGRLRLIEDDASKYLAKALENDDEWDVGYGDAYQGENTVHLPEPLILGLAGTCTNLWFNLIDKPDGELVGKLQRILNEVGSPVVAWYDANNGYDADQVRNLILTTQLPDPETAASFEPYQDLEGDEVDKARERYQTLLASEHLLPD